MEIYLTTKDSLKLENKLCVGMGFCSMRERYDLIVANFPRELDKVVNDIFQAEGLNLETADRRLWRSVRDLVVEAHHDSCKTIY